MTTPQANRRRQREIIWLLVITLIVVSFAAIRQGVVNHNIHKSADANRAAQCGDLDRLTRAQLNPYVVAVGARFAAEPEHAYRKRLEGYAGDLQDGLENLDCENHGQPDGFNETVKATILEIGGHLSQRSVERRRHLGTVKPTRASVNPDGTVSISEPRVVGTGGGIDDGRRKPHRPGGSGPGGENAPAPPAPGPGSPTPPAQSDLDGILDTAGNGIKDGGKLVCTILNAAGVRVPVVCP